MVGLIGPIIGKFYLHQQTKEIRLHLSYTIIHSIVKGSPNFFKSKILLGIYFYTVIDYYILLVITMVQKRGKWVHFIYFRAKIPFLIKLK